MKSIFVSSTFRDFQEERDVLRNVVLPQMNAFGREVGEEYYFADLRWGVNTLGMNEEESNREVLSVCLSEIDRSVPYMIVMLGERYGYMPGADMIQNALKQHGGLESTDWSNEIDDYDISVTELEILYRIYGQAGNQEHIWFYIRRPIAEEQVMENEADVAAKQKMDALKQRVLELAPDRVRYYSKSPTVEDERGLAGFAAQVLTDILSDLKSEYIQEQQKMRYLDQQYGQYFQNNSFTPYTHMVEEKRQMGILTQNLRDSADVRKREVSRLVENLASEERPIFLHGPVGFGKSVIMANVACRLGEQWGYRVCPISCMSSEALSRADGIIDYIRGFLQLRQDGEKCLFAVDGIDRLEHSDVMYLLGWLKPLNKVGQVRVLISAGDTLFTPVDMLTVTVRSLQEAEAASVIDHILKKMGKSLSEDIKDALIHALAAGDSEENRLNPLRLYMAVAELTLMDSSDYTRIQEQGDGIIAIRNHQMDKIASMPMDLEEMAVHLMETVCGAISPRTWSMVCYLSLSTGGLRESDLEQLLQMNGDVIKPLELSRLVNYLPELFMYRVDGRIDFAHSCIRAGLQKRLRENGSIEEYAACMAKYCDQLPPDDVLKEEGWTLLLYAKDVERFLKKLSGSTANSRMMAAKRLVSWLLDFSNPVEAGYLEEEGLWKVGSEHRMGEPHVDDDQTAVWKQMMSSMRPPSYELSVLAEPLRKRVEMVLDAVLYQIRQESEPEELCSLLKFFSYEFGCAYRANLFEGRENAKRAVAAVLVGILREPSLQNITYQNAMLEKYYLDLTFEACEVLRSTGFDKDRKEAASLITFACQLVQNGQMVEVFWALARLKEVQADIYSDASDEKLVQMAVTLYASSYESAERLSQLFASGDLAGGQVSFDEGAVALQKVKALLKLGLLYWNQGGSQYCNMASLQFEKILPVAEKGWKIHGATEMEQLDLMAERAMVMSQLYMAVGEDYRCRRGMSPEETMELKRIALSYGQKSISEARNVIDLRGQTVTGVHQLHQAYLFYLRVLSAVDKESYLTVLENDAYRQFNKWRMQTGCREGLLDMAELYELMIKHNDMPEGPAKEFQQERYTKRIVALHQRVEGQVWQDN